MHKTPMLSRIREIRDTYTLTYDTLSWIWREIVSPKSRQRSLYAVLLILLAMFTAMGTTYVFKEIITALAAGDRKLAAILLCVGVLGILYVSEILRTVSDQFRELGWNENYKSLYVRFSQFLFGRTLHELNTEENNIGAEQIEATKERVEIILYLMLFESPQVLALFFAVSVLTALVDWRVTLVLIILFAFNILWFLFFNATLSERMRDIVEGFRNHNSRTVDVWGASASVKSSGVEQKIVARIHDEVVDPLLKDKAVWVHWFPKRNLIRSTINNTVVVGMLVVGVFYWEWSVGEFAALFTWSMMILDRFGFVGHIMRQLTDQVARVQAVREALTTPAAFPFNEGVIYRRGSTCTSH